MEGGTPRKFKSIKGCLVEGYRLIGWGEGRDLIQRQNATQYKEEMS